MISPFRSRRHTTDDAPLTKADKHALRLNTRELYDWGSQVATYLAQRLEKPAIHSTDDQGERAEALQALQAVDRELTRRGA